MDILEVKEIDLDAKVLIIILLHRVSTILSKTLFRDNGIMYYGRYHILRGIK